MSNDNVVGIRPGVTPKVTDQAAPNPAIIKLFEDYLAAARDGHIAFAAVATVDKAGQACSTWEPDRGTTPQLITQALGSVAYLSHRFSHACVAGETETDAFGGDEPEKA